MEAIPKYTISQQLWDNLILELRLRGQGYRESGAFLLTKKNQNDISEFVCYDDLDSEALSNWGISVSAPGFLKLWEYASLHDLMVVADVHTHPGSIVSQSSIDKRNPMVSLKGHIALILPHFAVYTPKDFTGVGIYEYQGNLKWRTCNNKNQRLAITTNIIV